MLNLLLYRQIRREFFFESSCFSGACYCGPPAVCAVPFEGPACPPAKTLEVFGRLGECPKAPEFREVVLVPHDCRCASCEFRVEECGLEW